LAEVFLKFAACGARHRNRTRKKLVMHKLLAWLLVAIFVLPGSLALARGHSWYADEHAAGSHGIPQIARSELPREARSTLALIERGGPFPYARDGVVFGNYEHRLPYRPRGYYHEYTVKTPGARTRGARRIIAGAHGEYYYTDDHYRSFKRIRQ
jgi:ribonuclease T1